MRNYVIRRLLQLIPMLLLMSIALFALINFAPGDPLSKYRENPHVTAADLARLANNLGLNDPVPIKYVKWLKGMATGDWGYSLNGYRPVTAVIGERVPNTLLLMGLSFIISLLCGLAIGIYSARRRYTRADYTITVFSFLGISLPTFWFALIVMIIFSVALGWLPSGGMETAGAPFSIGDRIRHLIEPTIVLSLVSIAGWGRFMRSSMLETLQQDFIRTARAKGLSENKVVMKHALRNSLIPVATVVMLSLPGLLGGALVTETIFAWPGLGRLAWESTVSLDYPVIMAMAFLIGILAVVFNLIADLIYGWLDPRIRFD